MRLVPFAVIACLVSLSPCRAETYTVDNWPADADKIPCTAWQHNPDGN